jgi:hypothetical protein
MAVCLLFSGVSCKKDTEFTETVLLAEEEVIIDVENTIVIPADFDWTTIPDEYKDAVWDIQFDFDLNGETIVLPENVTLYFTGGSLSNGTVTGDGTSTIVSKTKYQVFDAVDLAGTFVEEQYLMPYWFGAVMNGITDDRDVFVETLAQAHTISARVMVDKNMFLDVEETGTKAIFIEDNTWIEGSNNPIITVNNLFSPVFHMPLSENITYKNFTIEWDQQYDAANMRPEEVVWSNQVPTEAWLRANRNITFDNTNPISNSVLSYQAIFLLDGAQHITMENITIKAVDNVTADRFIPMGIKFKDQFEANQVISDESTATRKVVKDVSLTNITFDGTLMGIQGTIEDFISDGMKSYRYSDAQRADGSYLGAYDGSSYSLPPPHLFYLNNNQFGDSCKNIEIYNTIDYGEYVGIPATRIAMSGYCNSLKLTDDQLNVVVNNYKSYRRDGLADIGNITNGVFKNIYSESDSSIFNQSFTFKSVRFVGTLENCSFENIDITDIAKQVTYYPFDVASGNHVEMTNLNVYVKELITTDNLCFGISGSNNTISNTSLNIEEHSTTEDYKGIVFHTSSVMNTGSNNDYNITVNGWRDISRDPTKQCAIMYFQSSSNTNWNHSKIEDTSNNFISEQEGTTKNDTWIRTEIVEIGEGTSKELNINIPAGFMVKNISANTLESLANGVELTLGTSSTEKANLLSTVSKTVGSISEFVNESTLYYGDRSIFLFSNSNFQSSGKVEITIELVKTTDTY